MLDIPQSVAVSAIRMEEILVSSQFDDEEEVDI